MSIWLIDLRMPEELFWRTMSPHRLHALLDARFGKKNAPQPQKRSLSEYLMGGG